MTKSVIYKFVCNLCGEKHESDASGVPNGWLGMYDPSDTDMKQNHICIDCVKDIRKRSEFVEAIK